MIAVLSAVHHSGNSARCYLTPTHRRNEIRIRMYMLRLRPTDMPHAPYAPRPIFHATRALEWCQSRVLGRGRAEEEAGSSPAQQYERRGRHGTR